MEAAEDRRRKQRQCSATGVEATAPYEEKEQLQAAEEETKAAARGVEAAATSISEEKEQATQEKE